MNLKLRILRVADVTQCYVNWFRDTEVTKFSNNQYRKITLDGQIAYVNSCLKDNNKELYGIFDDNIHIGNILLSGLKSKHNRAEITFVIGEKSYWNKGIMTIMVSKVIKLSKNIYKLNKLFACSASKNKSAVKVLEKNNFIREGVLKNHVILNNEYHDEIYYGLIIK